MSYSSVLPGDMPESPKPTPELPNDFPGGSYRGGGFMEGLSHVAKIAAAVADIVRAQKGLPSGPYMYGVQGFRPAGRDLGEYLRQNRPISPFVTEEKTPLIVGGESTVGELKSEKDTVSELLSKVLPEYQKKAFLNLDGQLFDRDLTGADIIDNIFKG
jgi:hypothetical protein